MKILDYKEPIAGALLFLGAIWWYWLGPALLPALDPNHDYTYTKLEGDYAPTEVFTRGTDIVLEINGKLLRYCDRDYDVYVEEPSGKRHTVARYNGANAGTGLYSVGIDIPAKHFPVIGRYRVYVMGTFNCPLEYPQRHLTAEAWVEIVQ